MTDKENTGSTEVDEKQEEEESSDDEGEEQKQDEADKKADAPPAKDTEDKVDKDKPHPDTIKVAELLKKQMGGHYKADWDKLPIQKRIDKMETALEILDDVKVEEKKKKKESRPPTGQSSPNSMDTGNFTNFKDLANKLANSK